MHFEPQTSSADFPRLLQAFINITGPKEWDHRVAWIHRQLNQNSFLHDYFLQIYSLELEFARLRDEIASNGRINIDAAERYRVIAFITTTAMVYERLTPIGKKKLRGMIFGGLRDNGLTPLQQEMSTVTHLMSRGFDVTFSDMETGSGFDFLVCKNGIELEVECKRVGLSLGRKVPRLEVLKLHKRIEAQVFPMLSGLNCGLFLRVVIPERLTANHDEQMAIAAAVGTAVRTGVNKTARRCRVEVTAFEISSSPFEHATENTDIAMLRAFIEMRFPVRNREMYMRWMKGGGAVVVSVESEQPDSLLDSLFDGLSDSVRHQFSKSRPGVLCVQFMDLTNEQIREIGTASNDRPDQPSQILIKTSNFLNSLDRSHVLCVAFRGNGVVMKQVTQEGGMLTNMVIEQGNAFFVTNENHPLAKDRRYAIFSSSDVPPRRVLSGK